MQEKRSIYIDEQLINYTVIRTRKRKKTIELTFDNGQLVVRSPFGVSYKEIDRLVRDKAAWILQQKEYIKQYSPSQKQFVAGEEFFFLGEQYQLKMPQDTDKVFTQECLLCVPMGDIDRTRQLIKKWYFQQAQEIINSRINYYQSLMGVQVKKVKIKEQKTLLGSCSYLGNININWKIIMAPYEIIDLIVVHELVHIKVRNHSAEFYREMGKILPDYRQRQKWLRENRFLLM
ncbi:MAG: SprT family zinc-dependent metalloprotease [Syntrophomonadaceae bacterium]|nr:SprT family zinc-dependent metalloprotease [Syntrophomonadaceae bacterium]MDD4548328.1 SprT family zinc-dependent metalloprotease [Syntrophomonadaceae bacterium]